MTESGETAAAPFDVWGAGSYTDAELDALDSGDDAGDEENEDGEQAGNEGNGNGAAKQETVADVVARIVEEREAQLAKAIEDGDTKNGVYKGLQRAMSRKDALIEQQQRELAELRAMYSGLSDTVEETGAAAQWLGDTVIDALDDADKVKATAKFHEKRADLLQKRGERKATPPAQRQQQPAPQGDEAFQQLVTQRKAAFLEGRRAAATKFGVDPNDAGLDYGSDDEGLPERVAKFEDSLLKVMGAKKTNDALESVRQKVAPVGTRSSAGVPAAPTTNSFRGADSGLGRAARQRSEWMRKQST